MPRTEKMSGTQLLVPADMLNRARALAIVRNKSVADTWRVSIDLAPLEAGHRNDLEKLTQEFRRLGVTEELDGQAMAVMIDDKLTMADLEGVSHFPWGEEA